MQYVVLYTVCVCHYVFPVSVTCPVYPAHWSIIRPFHWSSSLHQLSHLPLHVPVHPPVHPWICVSVIVYYLCTYLVPIVY